MPLAGKIEMKEHGTIIGDVMPMEIMARREDWNDGVSIYIRQRIYGVEQSFAKPIVFEKSEEGIRPEPAVILKIQQAQQLMDELWQCGLRPTEGTGSAGSLAATQRHLEDMRSLVFRNKK